jgi:FMN phosphatase YigB (HAD superfamily)
MPKEINLNKKGVIFDFDDTIANTKPGKDKALKLVSLKIYQYLEKRGLNINLNKLYKTTCKVAEEMEAKRIYDRNQWWALILKKFFKEKLSKSLLDNYTKKYWDIVIKKSSLYKNTLTTLNYLKNKRGYLLGLISDTDGIKGMKLQRIKALNLTNWFDSIVIAGEDTKEVKPGVVPFYLISKKLNLKPESCIFVGNNPSTDVKGAKKIGMTTILIKRGEKKIKTKPDRIIREISKLKIL